MQNQSKQDPACREPYTERLVVLQLLGRKDGLAPEYLERTLRPIEAEYVREAIAGLEEAGVVVINRTRIHQSATLRRIDELHLICV
jgi:hypothetical protein